MLCALQLYICTCMEQCIENIECPDEHSAVISRESAWQSPLRRVTSYKLVTFYYIMLWLVSKPKEVAIQKCQV